MFIHQVRFRYDYCDLCFHWLSSLAVVVLSRNLERGNCTAPNQCTCTCWAEFDVDDCETFQTNCDGPWQVRVHAASFVFDRLSVLSSVSA